MTVLLVWQELPEDVKFYVIDEPTVEQIRMLEMADNKFINIDDNNEGMDFIHSALAENGEWSSKEKNTPIKTRIDRVYTTGFELM